MLGNVQGDSDEEEAPVGETDVQRTEQGCVGVLVGRERERESESIPCVYIQSM